MNGIEQVKELPRALIFPHERKGHGGPDGALGVLAAIFAHARNVAFDVTGIERRFVEWRVEELD